MGFTDGDVLTDAKINAVPYDLFGDGSDGDLTVAAPANFSATKFYNDVTIDAGQALTWDTPNAILFVNGTLTVNGSITSSGVAGSNGTAAANSSQATSATGGVGGASGAGGCGGGAGAAAGAGGAGVGGSGKLEELAMKKSHCV